MVIHYICLDCFNQSSTFLFGAISRRFLSGYFFSFFFSSSFPFPTNFVKPIEIAGNRHYNSFEKESAAFWWEGSLRKACGKHVYCCLLCLQAWTAPASTRLLSRRLSSPVTSPACHQLLAISHPQYGRRRSIDGLITLWGAHTPRRRENEDWKRRLLANVFCLEFEDWCTEKPTLPRWITKTNRIMRPSRNWPLAWPLLISNA